MYRIVVIREGTVGTDARDALDEEFEGGGERAHRVHRVGRACRQRQRAGIEHRGAVTGQCEVYCIVSRRHVGRT